jgi:hypothetical protein
VSGNCFKNRSAADFRAFDPFSQFEAGFRHNVWESGVLKASRESYEFLAGLTGGSGSTRMIPRPNHASCRDFHITIQGGLRDLQRRADVIRIH